ncbi:M48 family metallopeptidase [Elizabethkingia miricola]|uniref:SprT family zinc-dependent metalloprotease n=1 Tax=Elizabethkingia miricola TaxID=172045 RepID=A0ABD5B2E1_ELIMR|nr:SprT family zinc-dependent metalloprotease [Elizabethkingia miricola]MDQ8747870.1 SprT family zinc-dependent metalloprotease [Elizabethkingia miricola]
MRESIQYGKQEIYFDLQYSKRKTIGVKILPDTSVFVVAPLETPLEKIKESLLKKAHWIYKQQSYFLNFDATAISYQIKSGYTILYLGRQYKLIVEKSDKEEVSYKGNLFLITVKNKEKAKILFDKWLKQRAYSKISEIAKPIIKKFSDRFNIPNHIYFQDMPTRWGSCTIKNKLIFNPKLIHTPKRCIEYVVMHELCHTIHKHHNQDFFDLLTLMMPDWEKRKEKLDSFA